MISLKQLLYALAVEKKLQFKKASEYCNVSQSALSTGISELERDLGISIFERDNKKVLVTPMGKQALDKARNILLQVEELEHMAVAEKSPLNFPITMGIIPTIAPFFLPKLFALLNESHAEAKLNIVEEESHVLVDMVRSGEIDTALLALPFPTDGLLQLEFWQEDFYWVALKGDAHTHQNEISTDELSCSNLMLLKEGHCLKGHILDACKLPAQTANHGFGATSLNTLIQMVLGGMGTTLIPKMAIEQLITSNQKLSAVHLKEPGPHRRIAFIIRPNYPRMSSIETLMKLGRQSLGNQKD
ncbi:MAG: LysR family transcriptional regulator [Gammaproteobacteria bacterium]|nr:LysR family transcriptional regulator [Gammaproteobacteria bacterium]